MNAENRYWIGGTGSWTNSKNWSTTSGGIGGASIPTTKDDVVFDQHSFQAPNQVVQIPSAVYCHSIDFSTISQPSILAGSVNSKLYISGNFSLSPNLTNGFFGQFVFTAASLNTTINTFGKTIEGKLVFNGEGSWEFISDIEGTVASEIIVEKGKLITNDKKITIGKFSTSTTNVKKLDLGISEVIILKLWDFSNTANLTFNGLSSKIIFESPITTSNYKSGNLSYGSVSALAAACGSPPVACAFFTISLIGTNVTCNGLQNGTASASVALGSGSYTYNWTPAPGAGQGSATATGLGSNTYIVSVTDIGVLPNRTCFCQISISEPAKLIAFPLSTTDPSCNSSCDGSGVVSQVGGTFPYAYSWDDPAATPNDTAINLCAGTYSVTVTDNNGCTAVTPPITITPPLVLTATGSSTNITCNGNNNGTASVTAGGGTIGYSYNWTGSPTTGQGTSAISNLTPGTYVVTVTDANGCTATYSATITEPVVLGLTGSQTNASCGGVCDGTATATVSGGTAPYTYVWSHGPTTTTPALTDVVSTLCAGGYTVTVTDVNGCTKSQTYTITQPAVLTASITSTNVACSGGSTGAAIVAIGGGTAAFSINWTPGILVGNGTTTITNLIAGTYSVQITDANFCTVTSSVIITEPLPLVAAAVGTDITCNGLCNGSITSTPTGGTGPYTYSWAPGGLTTQTISALCAGTYTVTVTDFRLCTSTQAITINEPSAIVNAMSGTNLSCNGVCDGTATVSASGGTSPYTYSWAPGGLTTPTISGLCIGTYTVTTTDFRGCTKTGTVTITQPNVLSIAASATVISCNGDCTSTISTIVAGGTPPYTYLWVPGGQTTASLTNQCAGSYTVTVTGLNGCTASTTLTVTQPTAVNLNSNATDVSCFGNCNGSLAAIAGGGTVPYTYLWSPGGQTTSSLVNQCAGTYTLTVTDFNGCTISDTLAIIEPALLSANPSVVSNVSCSAGCNGSATASPSGGIPPFTYNWSPGAPTGDGTSTVTGLCAGTYSVLVTDANLCTSSQSVTITQPSVLTAAIASSTSSCNICNGTATVAGAGGTGAYTYSWVPSGQTTQTATGLCPGVTYTVTVRDANNCTGTTTITVIQAVTIIITTSPTTLSCNGVCDGAVTANVAGGTPPYNYLWTPGNQTTQSLANLCAGTYTVTVSDAIGCFSTASVTFTNPPILTVATSKTDVTCGGALCDGTATANPAGGTGAYSYSWNTIPVQATQTATGLCAGTYTVTVKDVNNCSATTSVTITQPTVVDDNENVVGPSCGQSDGFIFVAPSGGSPPYVSYSWSALFGSPITGQGTNIVTNLAADIYTLTITDNSGCVFNFTYLLSNLLFPSTVMSKTNITCNGLCDATATALASGGVIPYAYDWLPGAPLGDGTPTISSLCSGTYTVQVTDGQGCIKFDTISVIEPATITPNEVLVNETCGGMCNGSITTSAIGGTGALTYLWSPGVQVTPSLTNLCAGTYTLDITDANGCGVSNSYTITSPSTLTVALDSTNVLCNGACNGTATANVVGGTGPYTYSWSYNGVVNGAFILPNIINLCPGQYIVVVTDANSCAASDTVNIMEPLALTAITSQTNISCFGSCNGVATVAPSGGTLPYTYLWNPNNAVTPSIASLCSGSYAVTVTDSNGCILTPPAIVITTPTQISPNVTFTNPACFGNCNGTATATPTGGSGATYTYLWSPGGQTTPPITGVCAGSYTVDITDSLGCTVNQIITLTNPAVLNANVSSTSPSCANGCDGSVMAAPVGGTPGYTYLWSPGGATTDTVANLCPNTYTVIVTDMNGCTDSQAIVLNNTLPIDAAISTSTATCGLCDGTASVNSITGTGPYTYLWNPAPGAGQGTPNGTQLCAGIYNVTVTDVLGCDSTFVFAISNAGGPTGSTDVINSVVCYGMCTGSASVVPIGGTPQYTYLWNTVPPTPNDTALNLCAGNYLVEITDANMCKYFAPISVTQPAQIQPNATIVNATCANICDGSITVAPIGGAGGYTYLWSNGGLTTPSIVNLCPGTYTLTTTDASLCVKVDTFLVGQSNPLVGTITSSLINCANTCNGVSFVTITSGTAPYLFQWNDPLGQTNDTASALCAGSYTVTIADAIGCISTATTTLNANPVLVANPTITNATCGMCDGQVTLAPTGGAAPYSYVWSNGQLTATGTNLCAGLYTVAITDALGCVTSVSILISNTNGPTSMTINSTNITCNGLCNGAVTSVVPVGGTAPYTYLWIQNGLTTSTLSNLCAGVYYLQITDSLGCSLLDSVVITEPAPILPNTLITAPTCNLCDGDIAIAPTGGSGIYTYLWSPGGATTAGISSLCAGVYTVLITDNTSGCTQSIIIPLNSNNGPTLSTTSTNITCNGACNGTATVVATGGTSGYTYLWNDASTQPTATATALCPGTYFVTVTDAAGCLSIMNTSIIEPDSIRFSLPNAIDPLCFGDANGSISSIPNGGTLPYTYAWTPSGGTASTASGLASGAYTVTITDVNGCTATQTSTLTDPLVLATSNVPTNPSCSTIADGAIDVTVTGGTQPYSYQWSGGSTATTEDLTLVLAGTFTITVTDAHGCVIVDSATLTPTTFVLANAGIDTSFCQPGPILLDASGSTNGVNYQWFLITPTGNVSAGINDSVYVSPPTGTNVYYVLVDNGLGCADTDTLNVVSLSLPTVDAGNNVTIFPGAATTIGGNPTGPAGSSYLWAPLPDLDNSTIANPIATPTVTTTYTVMVTAANGCIATDTIVVSISPQIVPVSGLSPNGDGVNDEWLIPNIDQYPDCVVEVYNRWGELLFQSKGYKEHWKGTFKNKALPVGTYYYVITLNDPLFPDPYTGPITILR